MSARGFSGRKAVQRFALTRARRMLESQARIVDIANALLTCPGSAADSAVSDALSRVGPLAGTDRINVFRVGRRGCIDSTHEWAAPGYANLRPRLQSLPADLLDAWRPDLEASRPACLPPADILPSASPLKRLPQMRDLLPMLALPVVRDARLVGIVGFGTDRSQWVFPPADVELLQLFANAVGTLMHREAEQVPAPLSEAPRDAARAKGRDRGKGFEPIPGDFAELGHATRNEIRLCALAMEASSDGIAMTNHKGRYVYMNSAYRRMFGLGSCQSAARGLFWTDTIPPAEVDRVLALALPRMQEAGTWNGRLKGMRQDGRVIELDVTVSVREDNGLLCIARDLTRQLAMEAEYKRVREELELAQRREAMAQVASMVAHDLNNLMAVVSGAVDLLEQPDVCVEELGPGLDRISRATDAAQSLVSKLLRSTRPHTAREPLDVRDIVTEAICLLGSDRVRSHGIRAALPDAPRIARADRTEMLQVILNLALNACESGADSGVEITVMPEGCALPAATPDIGWLEAQKDFVVFSVSDTGEGVDPAVRTSLFERYVTTKGDAGTGLGLPIVAGIVNCNEGALWFDSVRGRGTTVTVAWPAAAPDP